MKKNILMAFAATLLIASPALADGHGSQSGKNHGEKRFDKADANGDGQLSKQEMMNAHSKRIDKLFSKADTNGDGQLSKSEMKAHRDAHHKRKQSN